MGKAIQREIWTNSIQGNKRNSPQIFSKRLIAFNHSQHDIREAPSNVRDSYKMYYKLKTSFLEDTLSDALEDDAFDLSLLESSSQLDASQLSTSLSGIQTPDVTQLTSNDSAILSNLSTTISSPSETNASSTSSQVMPLAKSVNSSNVEPCVTEFEAERLDSFNEKAWGKELNRTNSTPIGPNDAKTTNAKDGGSSLRKTMSDKLFRNSSFVKRNPRKSLSRSSLTGSQMSIGSGGASQRETLPDLETILSQKSMKESEASASQESAVEHAVASGIIVVGKANSNLINSIDYEWLNRCNQNNALNTNGRDAVVPTASQSMPAKTMNQTYGLSNINANVLQTLESVPLSTAKKPNMNMPLASKAVVNDDEDEEEIANSEDETVNNNTVQIRSIRKSLNKRKHSEIDKPAAVAANVDDNISEAVKKDSAARPSIDRKVVIVKRVVEKSAAPQPMVNRRSARTRSSKQQYTETPPADDSDRENVDDPFAGDDSDADPDFGEEMKKKKSNNSGNETSTSESNQLTKRKTNKEKKTKKMVAKVPRKRVAKPPTIKPDRVRKVRRVLATRKKVTPEEANAEEVVEETPDDYLMEFGIDQVKSVPRSGAGELGKITQRFTEYMLSSAELEMANEAKTVKKSIASTSEPLTSKNSVARDKLEKRVAAGTLNENFVRVNLRKKVFVRGKKTVNFSRYKKQQWRNKKAAALTGPDMYMGGCDGGFSVCFQCGLPGHFAQDCKIKSEFIFVDNIYLPTNRSKTKIVFES